MKKLIGLFLIGAMLNGCGYPMGMIAGDSKTDSLASDWTAENVDPQLQASALKIIEMNCTSCHGNGSGPAGIHTLTSVNHLVSSGLVVPKNPEGSKLFMVIQSGQMPPGNPLAAADVAVLREWIAGGGGSNPPVVVTPTPVPTVVPEPGNTVDDNKALNILAVNCTSCHTATSGPSNVFNLTSKSNLISAGLIKPGDPNNSRIFIAIKAGTMPKAGPLSAADQETIRQFIMAAGGGSPTAPEPPPATPEPKFSYLSTNVIGPKCASCHYTGSAKGGYAFDTYAGVIKAVKTSRPTDSDIYKAPQKGDMPPKPNAMLSSAELNLILTWIQNGAKND